VTVVNIEAAVAHRAALSVRGLTVSLPKGMERAHAVEDISFELARGEILCVVGESGSGKSVTANAIMGLLPKSIHVASGEIRLGGANILGLPPGQLRDLRGRVVSMIFQDPLSALNPLMTVGAQIEEAMAAHGVGTRASRRERALALLSEVGLPDPRLMIHQYPFRLSGGQRQRVMIAMALALEPSILIADEPTTALDVTTQAQILKLIRDIQRRKGMSVMFITHDFGVVAEIADSVVVMEKGRVVEQGSPAKVLKTPTHPYTRRLIAAVPRLRSVDRANAARDSAAPLLKVENLVKTYRSGSALLRSLRVVPAVQGISFQLAPGRTLGVVGESGSGKSSLGRLLIRLMDADGGRILFEGTDIAPLGERSFRSLRPKVQMIFQDPFASLNPRMTIGTIMTVGPIAHGMAPSQARDEAHALLTMVGLDAGAYGRYPHEFSGGQRQRVGIARALMFKPKLLVADEPVSALDVSIQAQILELLDRIQRETGVAMVFITHDLRVASQICDEIAVMHKGRIVEQGPPSQIFFNPRADYTRELVAAIPGEQADARPAVAAQI
jgi:peptide/nickel transport system ATP-binding protein